MSHQATLSTNAELGPAISTSAVFMALLIGHFLVDSLAALLPASLGLVEIRLSLTAEQTAWLLGLGPLASGLAQPICALLSDRLNTRVLGIIGIALGGLGIGAIGLAGGLGSLAFTYMLGMIGIGMFHPVAAATVGQLRHERRNSAVSIFFVAGMAGGVLGAFAWPKLLLTPVGFELALPLALIPAVLIVVVLQRGFQNLQPLHNTTSTGTAASSSRADWLVVSILYVAAAMRFCVNLALFYLYLRWSEQWVATQQPLWNAEEVTRGAVPMVSNFNSATLLGMAIGGVTAGLLVKTGAEKWPMVLVPLGFAPVIAFFPHAPVQACYVLAILAGAGFAAMIPVTITLAQQTLPHRANLASSLMMGGAWAVATVGPRAAEFGVSHWGVNTTFAITAAGLACSGLLCLLIRNPAPQ